jgi:hypothetical protein
VIHREGGYSDFVIRRTGHGLGITYRRRIRSRSSPWDENQHRAGDLYPRAGRPDHRSLGGVNIGGGETPPRHTLLSERS